MTAQDIRINEVVSSNSNYFDEDLDTTDSKYDKDSEQIEVEFNSGVKIFGGWSRAKDQRSLSIFARGEYSTPFLIL